MQFQYWRADEREWLDACKCHITTSALCGNVSLANIKSKRRIRGNGVALILLLRDEQLERTWVGH
jgi:hypothetical protein